MKLNNLTYLIICLFAGTCFTSCNLSSSSLSYSHGSAGEVLIVMQEYHWNGALGDSVRGYLTEPVLGLNSPEPTFSLSQIPELNSTLQKFRNIVIFKVDPGFETSRLTYKSDAFAKYQLIFNIEAPSADSAIACINKNKDLITSYFLTKDRDAIINDYQKSRSGPIFTKMREKNQVDIVIPSSYLFYDEKDDFEWIKRKEGEREWHILMWKYPYLRTSQLDTDSLIFKMNAMTRKYVPGDRPGSYMADEPTVPPVVKILQKDGVYTVQMNGLWQLENGFMGGPYISQTIVDSNRGQLVTALGFVFYPNRDKRQMIRQLEAIIYTMMPTVEAEK